MIATGDFLEYAHVFGCLYGTSKRFVFDQIAAGYSIGLELDWQGARSVRKHLEDVASVFILPPSKEDLRRRLEARGQDSDEVIENRMDEAMAEMEHYDEFDYIVVNDDFATACETLATIVRTGEQSPDAVEHSRHVLRRLGL